MTIRPTHTIYEFRAGGVDFTVAFCSPLLPRDLDLVSRPIAYLTVQAQSADAAEHAVTPYVDCSDFAPSASIQ